MQSKQENKPQEPKIATIEQKLKALTWLKPLIRYGSAVLAIAILAAMLFGLWQVREDLFQVLGRVSFSWLSTALGLNILATLVYCAIWYYSGQTLGKSSSYRAMLTVVSLSSAGRYLPGGIWAALGLVGLSSRVGMTLLSIPVLFGLAQGLHLLLAWSISLVGLAWYGSELAEAGRVGLVSLLVLGLLLSTVLLLPRYFQPLINRLPDFGPKVNLKRPALFRATASSLLVWLLCGLRLGAILLACQANLTQLDPLRMTLYLTWVSAISGIALALFFFVPLGLGAVELGLATFLGLLTNDWPLILAVLLLNRVVQIVTDFIAVAYGLYYLKKLQSSNSD